MVLMNEKANTNNTAGPNERAAGGITFDEDRFGTIDTADKAYWYGYIFFSATIQPTRQTVDITAALNDATHLVRFQEFLGCRPVRTPEAGQGGIFSVRLISARLVADLIRLHITPDLRERTVFPSEIFNARPELLRHFVRGLFDRRPLAPKIAAGEMVRGTTVGYISRMAQAIRSSTQQGPEDTGLDVSMSPQRDGSAYLHIPEETLNEFGKYLYEGATTFNPGARDLLLARIEEIDGNQDPALAAEKPAPPAPSRDIKPASVSHPVVETPIVRASATLPTVESKPAAATSQPIKETPQTAEVARPTPLPVVAKAVPQNTLPAADVPTTPAAVEEPAAPQNGPRTAKKEQADAPVIEAKEKTAATGKIETAGSRLKESGKEKEVKMSQEIAAVLPETVPLGRVGANGATGSTPSTASIASIASNGKNGANGRSKTGAAAKGALREPVTRDYEKERAFVERTTLISPTETALFSAPQALLERLRVEANAAGLSFEEFITVALLHETIARTQARGEEFGLMIQLKM